MRFSISLLVLSTSVYAETPLSVDDIRDIHCAGIDEQIQRMDESYWEFVEIKKVVGEQYKAALKERPKDYKKIQKLRAEMKSTREITSKWSEKTRESLIFKYTVCSTK